MVRHLNDFVTIEVKALPQYSNKREVLAAWLAPLTDDGVVLDAEQLGLVVSRDCGVRIHVSGQHGQAGGHIRSLHPFFFWVLLIWMLFDFLISTFILQVWHQFKSCHSTHLWSESQARLFQDKSRIKTSTFNLIFTPHHSQITHIHPFKHFLYQT